LAETAFGEGLLHARLKQTAQHIQIYLVLVIADSIQTTLSQPEWIVNLFSLQPAFLARPVGMSENALPGGSEQIAQLVALEAGKPN